jgi:multiple sugar transport system substrate-binding protein
MSNGGAIDGISMHLKVGGQGPFHYWSLSAPYIIGPENTSTYWFNPDTMDPLLNSAGHVAAAEMIKKLFDLGPQAQAGWALGEAWDHFLQGNAVFTFSWGDVLPLAYENDSPTKGNIGTAQLPGTLAYTNPLDGTVYTTETPNIVGNTTGGSWAGVVMKGSANPEPTYYFFALMATEAKQRFYAGRGSDGVDPGRWSQMPPEAVEGGTGALTDYTGQGWVEADALEYAKAYYDTFNNPLQLPYLRIPGTDEYRNAMDIRMSEYFTGQTATAQEAMDNLVNDMRDITDRLGLDIQKDIYRRSLGL